MNEVEDIIDLSQISFDDDETWLYESPKSSTLGASASLFIKHPTDILNHSFIKEHTQDLCSKESSSKYINTQTFTRPKKKFIRPSIEKYNQELFCDNNELLNRSSSPESPFNKTLFEETPQMKPLEFDLTQSVTTCYFDRIAANVENEDTFQNESLPSLVNSMCSSTFTNLMESSFIKNDPVLKQICDTDFTASILSQGSEPSSLLNSNYGTNDVDDFLNKVSQDDIMKTLELNGEMKCSGDASYIVYKKDVCDENKKMPHIMDFEEYHDASDANFAEGQNQYQHNGTFRKNTKLSSATFRKTDYNRPTIGRNHTYEIDPKDVEEARNVTLTVESPKSSRPHILKSRNETIVKSSSMEDFKKTTILKDNCNNDLNRYASKESNLEVECINSRGGSKKSLDCSIGSADSLDRMSTLSSSSKGSNKMLNMEEVEAIAEKQEQSLHNVMSTPKPNWSNKMFNRVMWEHSIISPIVTGDIQSDSGDSSDEYKSVKSSFSKISLESNPVKQTRSLVSLQDPSDARKLKSINTVVNPNNFCKVPMRGSASNLQKLVAPVPKLPQARVPSAGSITSNLKTMKPSLKGSYTSLKPVNSYLPVAPPINAPSQGQNSTYVAPVNPSAQNQGGKNIRNQAADTTVVKMSGDGVFVKPNGPLRSGLPRPTSSTSIPKPVSRIPGPRRFIPQKQDPRK
ncbi:uncharacterized protein LOC123309306 [Coccinella septempunctata]|uniref:uncharacterized protein LOC123309306 n=1 Tax=Coccinella septempunctata TaxID=41139 RepID=UPI001D062F28|nr:uncharacterized protein LOC123309306 [Coccinella septempunctata]